VDAAALARRHRRLTAYILAQNKLIDATLTVNAQTLPKVQMPNRDGFIPRFPERIPTK
jgi:S-disulfanyl-L-cysteine oxidoreductase SoxD